MRPLELAHVALEVSDPDAWADFAERVLGLVVVEGLPGGLVLDQLDRRQKTAAPHLAHQRMIPKAGHSLLELGSDVVMHALDKPLALDDFEVLQRHRAGNRMT